jgi:hypothetical protein
MIWPLCRDSLGIGRHTPIYLILFALPSFNLDIGSGLSKEDIEPLSWLSTQGVSHEEGVRTKSHILEHFLVSVHVHLSAYDNVISFCLLAILGFDLRDLHLLGRCSSTWTMSPAPQFISYTFPQHLILSFQSMCDYYNLRTLFVENVFSITLCTHFESMMSLFITVLCPVFSTVLSTE